MGYARPSTAESAAGRVHRIKFVLWVVLLMNVTVALAKLVLGYLTNSVAIQADGFHSLFDGTSNVVGLLGMGMAGRPADLDHPYGHGKYETYASGIIGAMLLFAAYRIGSSAIERLTGKGEPPEVTTVSFAIMVGTLAVNIFVTLWEHYQGKKLASPILVADARHTSSDVLVTVGVIIGLVFVRMGYVKADAITALLVSVAIVYTAWQVFKEANVTLSDAARIPPAEICEVVTAVPGVLGCHTVRTRGSEAEVYVDLHIQVDPQSTVAEGHEVAEAAERAVVGHFDQVADVIAHLEPMDEYQAGKTALEHDAGLA